MIGRRSSKRFSIDISGIDKLDSDTTPTNEMDQGIQPASQVEDNAADSDPNHPPSNPFKKYNASPLDNILIDEVKAIMAQPKKILKLPSF